MIRDAQVQASRKTLNSMTDGFIWGVVISGLGFALIGTFSIAGILAAGIGGAFIEGARQ